MAQVRSLDSIFARLSSSRYRRCGLVRRVPAAVKILIYKGTERIYTVRNGEHQTFHRNPIPGEIARDLAYRLYSLCDRKGWTQEAIAYNSLVISWSEISRLSNDVKQQEPIQTTLL